MPTKRDIYIIEVRPPGELNWKRYDHGLTKEHAQAIADGVEACTINKTKARVRPATPEEVVIVNQFEEAIVEQRKGGPLPRFPWVDHGPT